MADPATEPLLRGEGEGEGERRGSRRKSVWEDWEDPDDTAALLDEDAIEARDTVYKGEVEAEHLAGEDPSSLKQVMKQGGLCVTLIMITVYEAVLKGRAVREAKFDFTSLLIMQALVSVIAGVGMAFAFKETVALQKDFAWNTFRYAPVGILFGAGAYVQLITFVYISPDVFKVLEQSRLLVLAILGRLIMKKRYSISSWVALFSITFVVLTYGQMRQAAGAQVGVQKELEKDLVRAHGLSAHFDVPEAFAQPRLVRADARAEAEVDGSGQLGLSTASSGMDTAPPALDAKAQAEAVKVAKEAWLLKPDAKDLKESLEKLASGTGVSESKSPVVGFVLTVVFVLLVCFASIYSEMVLKADKHIPYYIQKVYQEITAGLFSVFASFCLRPLLMNNGIATEKLKISFADEGNLFFGWDNAVVPVLFVFFLAKAWLSGLIVKQLSAISKQLCSTVAVVLVYFFLLVHDCRATGTPESFFCPANLGSASFPIIVIDLGVLAAVMGYTTALRDKTRKKMFKQRIAELEGDAAKK